MPVIDAHAHIYPSSIAARAVEAVGSFYSLSMAGDGTVESLLAARAAAPITHFIVHSVATSPKAVTSINDFIASQCAQHSEFIGFGTMHHDCPDMEAEVQRALDLGLHGFKLHPDTQKVNMDDPRLMAFYEIVQGRAPVVVHTGDYRYDYSHPRRLKRILRTFPDLVVDAAHFGGWSIFERGYDELASELLGEERLFVDTSSSEFALGTRRLTELARMWGTSRVMFGSDFPMWSPVAEYNAFMKAPFSEDELELLLWRNAERFSGVHVE